MLNSTTKYRFGDKIRSIRERKGITLRKAAESAGISESMLSQIEHNRVSPSIDTLLSISDALEMDVEYFFRAYKQNREPQIVRKNQGGRFTQAGISYTNLAKMGRSGEAPGAEALYIELEPGTSKNNTEFGHPGEEIGYIIQGNAKLLYGNGSWELTSGDSVSFSSSVPHRLENTGETPLRALWIVSPPRAQ
ncbi:MAG: helix-turn-helix domain-containing protein [Spirochaetia bacterium]